MEFIYKIIDIAKRKKVVILVVFVVLLFIYIFSIRKGGTSETATKQFIKPPEVQNYFGNSYKINLETSKKDFIFPEELPYLKQNKLPPFSNEYINSISKNNSFNSDPIEIKDATFGKFYIWNNDKHSLFLYPAIRKIKISPSYNPTDEVKSAIDQKLTNEEYINLSKDILINKLELDSKKLKYLNTIKLEYSEEAEVFKPTEDVSFDVTQLNFYLSTAEYPIYLLNGQDSQIYLNFTKTGGLLNLEAYLYSDYTPSDIKYRLRNFDEVKNSIKESVILNLDKATTNLPDLDSNDIKDVSINKISLIYLLEGYETDIIQPVFLLEGTSLVTGFSTRIPVTMYLPAFSKQ